MPNVSLQTGFGINNVIVPKGGPRAVIATCDFGTAGQTEIDGEAIVDRGGIEFIQGVFIDNSTNANKLTLTMGTTGQIVVCPPQAQGYFAIMLPNPPKMVATTIQVSNLKIPLIFYNVPIQSAVWKIT
jgi:hypothetical protein